MEELSGVYAILGLEILFQTWVSVKKKTVKHFFRNEQDIAVLIFRILMYTRWVEYRLTTVG